MTLLFRAGFAALFAAFIGAAMLTTTVPAAADASCNKQFKVKSTKSSTKAQIKFVNESGFSRAIMFIGFDGHPVDQAHMGPGESVVVSTTTGHFWMVVNGPGDCIKIFQASAGNSLMRLPPVGNEIGATRDEGNGPTLVPNNAPQAGGGAEFSGGGGGGGGGDPTRGGDSCPRGTLSVPETDNCVEPTSKNIACIDMHVACIQGNQQQCNNFEANACFN